ncbi:hypothetical protein CYY_005106 [Polysphondylium violaceum]|uniref:Uncharacterized protein n=1 Tax=Polysphondylium violaceum TaxID=133409 RepID=A0A8J4V754_9MYCE|nr:hypothetical protein CYY_005106 [Polysphondylium violaceum]
METLKSSQVTGSPLVGNKKSNNIGNNSSCSINSGNNISSNNNNNNSNNYKSQENIYHYQPMVSTEIISDYQPKLYSKGFEIKSDLNFKNPKLNTSNSLNNISLGESLKKYSIIENNSNNISNNNITNKNNSNNNNNNSNLSTSHPESTLNGKLNNSKTNSITSPVYSTSLNTSNPKRKHFRSFSLDKDEAKNILSNHIQIREKEIGRQTKLAEKDKRDSLAYSNYIKEYKELLHSYIKDFYEDTSNPSSPSSTISIEDSPQTTTTTNEHNRKNIIEKVSALLAIEGTANPQLTPIMMDSTTGTANSSLVLTPPSLLASSAVTTNTNHLTSPSSVIDSPPLSSLSFWDPPESPKELPSKSTDKEGESVSVLVNSYQTKDEELERVRNRAHTEAVKSAFLKEKYEELSQLVQSEREYWGKLVEKKRKQVEFKEKEIVRLLLVAENHKKKSMQVTDQITKLKKSISTVSQLRSNSNLDMKKINEKFSYESLCSSPSPSMIHHNSHQNQQLSSSSSSSISSPLQSLKFNSPGTNRNSSSSLFSPNINSSNNNNQQQSPIQQQQQKYYTEEKKELVHLNRLLEKKENEIHRIRDILEYESLKTIFLTNKANELKLILEEESRQVDSLQNQSQREIREKEDAIFKVALRAQKERLKSNQLKDEIKKLTRALNLQNGKKQVKSPELEPVFVEMGDLKQFQDLSLDRYCDENILSDYIANGTPAPCHTHHHFSPTPISTPIYCNSPKSTTNLFINNNNSNNSNNHHNMINNNNINNNGSISIPVSQVRKSSSHDNLSPTSRLSPRIGQFSPSNSFSGTSNNSFNNSSFNSNLFVGSPSEVIMHKLKEIDRLHKESSQKEKELGQVKKIAEAERTRLALLKDKLKELKTELTDQEVYSERYSTKTY